MGTRVGFISVVLARQIPIKAPPKKKSPKSVNRELSVRLERLTVKETVLVPKPEHPAYGAVNSQGTRLAACQVLIEPRSL